MNFFNDNDFLERLMPHLQREVNLAPSRCPDADTICAIADGEASEWIQGVFAEHLTQCPRCSELYRRVRAADSSSIAEQDIDWTSVEKRLDDWFEAFIASNAPVQRRQSNVSLRSRRDKLWEVVTAWRIPLAVSFACMLVLVAAGLLFRRPPVTSQQTAAQTILPPHPVARSQQTSTPAKPSAIPNTPSAAKGSTFPGDLGVKRGTTSDRLTELEPAIAPEVASRASSAPIDTRSHAPVASTGENRTFDAQQHTQPRAGTKAAALVSQYPRPAPNTKLGISAGAALKLPASFQLESGTRLWISLRTIDRHSDGHFTFAGTLLLPVTQAKSIRLDQRTEIEGAGSVSQKKVSVVIAKLIVQGVPYAVANAPVEAHSSGAGGNAVQFDSGQVLEMWLASTSVFARVPVETGQR